MIHLFFREIADNYIRENFRKIQAAIEGDAILRSRFRHIEFTVTSNVTNQKYPHGLTFIPVDLIQTSKKGSGTLTWNYDQFDTTDLVYSTTGVSADNPLIVRALIGAYEESL